MIPTAAHDNRFPCLRTPRSSFRLGAGLLVALLLTACGDEGSENEGEDERERSSVSATWIEAEPQTLRVTREAVGSLESRSQPLITAEVGGVIEKIHHDEGDPVDRGDLLAEIESEDYRDDRDQAAAEVAGMTARVGVQERDLRRARELHADNHISEDELDNVEAELESRQAELDAALAQLRRAKRALERTRIRAAIDGQIDARNISEGDYVRAGDAAFELVDTQRLRARLSVSEALIPRLVEGSELVLRNRSADQEETTVTVSDLRPTIERTTRSLQVLADFENPDGWRPGASIKGELVLDQREAIVVPTQSVVRRPAGETVFVLGEGDERVEARTVELGARQADRVEIRSGLEPGDRVIVDGARFLSDGATVQAEPHEAETE
ncbi:MAG: efflux RND transporter periplasmic adaptor subunit [Halorhodospira sp.]